MPRKTITVGDGNTLPGDRNNIQKTIFLANSGLAGEQVEYVFTDGSINYFDVEIKQTFEYILVDNIGESNIRIAFNRLGLDLSSSQDGAKTLKGRDSLYIQDSIESITIYFINTSEVELVLISN